MIEGHQINLRTMLEKDMGEVFTALSNLREKGEHWPVTLPSDPLHRKMFAETGFWNETYSRMLITDKVDTILGEICFFKNAPHHAGLEIGYHIYRQADRGRGITTEALRLFSAYLFDLLPIPRLQITCLKENTGSRRVAEKCGFTYEGCLRQATFSRGEHHDLELFSLLRQECPPLKDMLQSSSSSVKQ
ncbi:MAG TPA: GNAT family protein [Patescibacteria group bacterium]|nr:GNAT family protein [Patescibacteria group bacterium]